MVVEVHLHRLVLIVMEALVGATVHALFLVEQPRCLVPLVTQRVDVEDVLIVALLHHDGALARHRIADLGIADACLFHKLLKLVLVLVADLYNDAGVLGHESLHHVVALNVVEVYAHAALCVGEAHLKKRCDETTGRDVVTCHDPALLDHLLNSVEAVGKIVSILHRGHVAAHLTQALGEG